MLISNLESSKSAALIASNSDEHHLVFHNMRRVMNATLAILDEKTHVMNTAMDALDRQLRRCQSSYLYIGEEISEEARYGSFNHWAYTDKAGEKKSILVGERTRRSQNIQDAKDAEGAAIRSDLRREAMKSSKGRNQHVDSDFDDTKLTGKKGQPGPKGRRIAVTGYAVNGVGLGIANAAPPPSKRRKTEKAALADLPAERAMTSVYGSQMTVARGREPAAAEPKRKPKAAALTTNGTTRRRGNTNTSGINSPLASSPIMGTFAAPGSKDRSGRSPAPAMQRMPSARARQNSSQSVMTLARNRSSSMNHKNANGNNGGTAYGLGAEIEKVSSITGRATSDAKSSTKEATNAKGEHAIENFDNNDGPGDVRGGLQVGNKTALDRNSKREEQAEPPNGRRADRPPPVSVQGGGNGRGGGTSSKAPSANPTPRDSSFGERARQPRGAVEQPQKRSHKKGAGLAAQLAAQAARKDDDGSSAVEEDEDGDGENEPRYCYCQQVSYGEMVGCDAKDCKREWFHLPCVGMTKPPPKTGMPSFFFPSRITCC